MQVTHLKGDSKYNNSVPVSFFIFYLLIRKIMEVIFEFTLMQQTT